MSTCCHLLFLGLFLSLLCCCKGTVDDQSYNEGLKLKHLPDGRVLAYFEHVIEWNMELSYLSNDNTIHHYGVFPKALAEVIGHYSVQELHLTLTRGKWRTAQWGYPPVSSPPGAEFWVWFLPNSRNVDSQWKGLSNGVSGLMCTSLSSIAPSSTYTPPLSFRPHGAVLGNLSSSLLRYSALPREPVCTENLTPFTKLLPCGHHAGIGSLYAALKLYDADYHSIGIHFKPVCLDTDCTTIGMELYQTLSVVFKPEKKNDKIQWSLSSLFTRTLHSHCPLAGNRSRVLVDVTNILSHDYNLTPPTNEFESQTCFGVNSTWAVYDIARMTADSKLDISLKLNKPFKPATVTPPILSVQRYVTGSGLERGGIVTEITNLNQSTSLTVLLLDMVPWYLRVLLHTLSVECVQWEEEGGLSTPCDNDTVLSHHFSPAKDRLRPYTSEFLLALPPSSKVTLSVQFMRAFLKWNEYPPDASHGFYVNSAVLTAALRTCFNCTSPVTILTSDKLHKNDAHLLRIHTNPLLVLLPTPDFSMPYNVICFVSTVVAIGFGSVFNLTTKKLKPDKSASNNQPTIFQKILSIFRKKSEYIDKDVKTDKEKKVD